MGGQEERIRGGGEQKGFGHRNAVRGSQTKPRAGSRVTVGESKLDQAHCQTFLPVLISSVESSTKTVVCNNNVVTMKIQHNDYTNAPW